MDLIPLPELVAALVISTIALGIRVAWRAARSRLGRRPSPGTNLVAVDLDDAARARARLVASCVMLVIISIPLILRLVPPNGIYGFRTEATRSTPEIWYSANTFMGWALSLAAVASATLLLRLPINAKRWVLWGAFVVPLAGAIALSFAYLRQL